MCFMNSILQALVYCVPFYNLLGMVGSRLAYKIHSKTPILDSLIMFMREFALTQAKFEDNMRAGAPFGDSFIPEFVYEAMRSNQLFASMRRGHQEDAEEFLGFLLDGLHEEFVAAIDRLNADPAIVARLTAQPPAAPPYNDLAYLMASLEDSQPAAEDDGWLEVGKKNRVSVTRTTAVASSPITNLFGGSFRSVISVARQKPSVTLDPYQRVQLDISAPDVRTIEDALAHVSRAETVPYKANSGETVDASKQTFFETLPRILILHLKRFDFVLTPGSAYASIHKITKTVGYGRALRIPPECIAEAQRATPADYKLFGVVYHHGKSAEGGHYTVDLHRRHHDTWINIDDTHIREIAPDAVDTAYEDALAARRRAVAAGVADDRTAYLLFYERVLDETVL
ncbi:uncharacterized protein V1510DRAFT_423120 [Dipodascopsis tothii]|uniref:uncharacterized protein n=1 Tax=Dipodascopsis tothii TaxID=44089 RepID=UPI0034CD5097